MKHLGRSVAPYFNQCLSHIKTRINTPHSNRLKDKLAHICNVEAATHERAVLGFRCRQGVSASCSSNLSCDDTRAPLAGLVDHPIMIYPCLSIQYFHA